MPRPKALLLDANALLHRAWHALPPLTGPGGKLVNAAYGVTSVVLKLIREEQPELFVACWDTVAATFRHEAYEAYKAHREEQPDDLYEQIPITKETLKTLGIPSVEKDGFEADDVLGTLAVLLVREGFHVRIVTGDRDALQLIAPHVDVLTFKKGVSETKLFTAHEVQEEYGIAPTQLVDWKALRGDASDNIPGVPGVGEKTATELLQAYNDLEGIFRAAHDPASALSPKLRQKLLDGEASGREALALVDIKTDVPLSVRVADLKLPLDRDAFVQAAAAHGFRSLIVRLPQEHPMREEPHPTPTAVVLKKQGKRGKPVGAHRQIADPKEGVEALREAARQDEVAVVVSPAPQGSLFGSASFSSVTLGWSGTTMTIPSSLLADAAMKRVLGEVLGAERPRKCCHDAKVVMRELEGADLPFSGIAHDTLIVAYLLAAGERSLDLETLALQCFGRELPQGDERPAAEARVIEDLAARQRQEMHEAGAVLVWERFERPLIPVLRRMERTGIGVDIAYLHDLAKVMRKEKSSLERKMERMVGHAFNPGSPSQLAVILFEELKLPTKGIKRGKTGFSTAAPELEKLEGAHPLLGLIREHREVAKLLSTYVETLPTLADNNGRVHTTFNQAIAATGRLSSSDPNLQNIPIRTESGRKIRRAFVASPGMELLSLDYSQIELRVIAALAKDDRMLAAFHSGQDIHAATAAAIWNIPIEQVTKDQRRAAKAINFGIIYGQGPQGLSRAAGIPFAEAKQFIAAYFETYQGIRRWLDATKEQARTRGFVETYFGRRRPIPEIKSGLPQLRSAAERMAINMPVQGTGTGDLVKLALIDIADRLPTVSPPSRLLLQVHDEILLEVPSKDAKRVATFARDIMENVDKDPSLIPGGKGIGVPLVVEAKKGKNWEEMKTL